MLSNHLSIVSCFMFNSFVSVTRCIRWSSIFTYKNVCGKDWQHDSNSENLWNWPTKSTRTAFVSFITPRYVWFCFEIHKISKKLSKVELEKASETATYAARPQRVTWRHRLWTFDSSYAVSWICFVRVECCEFYTLIFQSNSNCTVKHKSAFAVVDVGISALV